MNTAFCLEIELRSPIVFSGYLTLDAILASALFKESQDYRRCVDDIPLERAHGIPKASAVFLPKNGIRYIDVDRVGALRGLRDLSPSLFAPKKNKYVVVDTARGTYQARLDVYKAIQTPVVYYFGVGDAQLCKELLATYLPGLGKKTNTGSGEIGAIHIHPTDSDFSWVAPDGQPMRPIPLSIWQASQSVPPRLIDSVTYQVPYSDTNLAEICALPSTHQINVDAYLPTEEWSV